MKNTTRTIATLATVAAVTATTAAHAVPFNADGKVYADLYAIVALDYVEDTFKIISFGGDVYELTEPEDLLMGDCVVCMMNDNGTPDDFADDQVLSVKYVRPDFPEFDFPASDYLTWEACCDMIGEFTDDND